MKAITVVGVVQSATGRHVRWSLVYVVLSAATVAGTFSCRHATLRVPSPAFTEALRLEIQVPSLTVQAGVPFEVWFALRNVTCEAVRFCQSDGGVSVGARSDPDGPVRPLLLHGLVLDAACYEETTLTPGATKEFREKVVLWKSLSGAVDLLAQIRLHDHADSRRRRKPATIRSPALRLRVTPPPNY
jgi:hypothetical protein